MRSAASAASGEGGVPVGRKPVIEKCSFCKGATGASAASKRNASRPSGCAGSILLRSVARDSVSVPARGDAAVSAWRVNSAADNRHQDTLLPSGTRPKMRPAFMPTRGKIQWRETVTADLLKTCARTDSNWCAAGNSNPLQSIPSVCACHS